MSGPARIRLVTTTLLSASLFTLAPAAHAVAQSGAVWIAGGIATRGDARVTTDFEPPRLFGLEGSGRATQTADAEDTTLPLLEAGAQWFPARHFGVEVWVSRDRGDQQAPSSTYDTRLTYVSRPPPDHLPREFTYERAADWPAVRVDLVRYTLGLNAAVRPVASPRLAWIVSGGLARVRLSGEAEPLGFTTFALGGHSVLFPNEYRLTTSLEPTWAWRANAGSTVDVTLSTHLALTAGARAVFGDDIDLRLRVAGVDRSQAGFEPPGDADIDEALAASAARVATRSLRVAAGLKVLF